MSSKRSAPVPDLDFADVTVLLTRFRTMEKCQFGLTRLLKMSSLVTSNLSSSSDPLLSIAKENDDLTRITASMNALMEADRKALYETLPVIFLENGELSEFGCDVILVFLYLTGGSVISIVETMMMLYSIEVKDIDENEESVNEATSFLKPYLNYFSDRFVEKGGATSTGFKMTEEADDRIDAVITQLKQSPRNFGGLESFGGASKPTVH